MPGNGANNISGNGWIAELYTSLQLGGGNGSGDPNEYFRREEMDGSME